MEGASTRHRDDRPGRFGSQASEIGIIQGKLQSGDQGLDSLEKARAIQQGLIARYPGEIRYRREAGRDTWSGLLIDSDRFTDMSRDLASETLNPTTGF